MVIIFLFDLIYVFIIFRLFFTNQYVRKLILLRYICRIILKLTFLLQLFSKFRENVTWPVKFKTTISAKIFFRETLKGLCIETDNSAYFWRLHNRFRKSNYLTRENFVGQNFHREKFLSPGQNFVNFLQRKFSPLYKKIDIWKKVIQ